MKGFYNANICIFINSEIRIEQTRAEIKRREKLRRLKKTFARTMKTRETEDNS